MATAIQWASIALIGYLIAGSVGVVWAIAGTLVLAVVVAALPTN